jgi:hypothetical protein
MTSRRKFLAGSAAGFFGAAAASRVALAALPEAPIRETAEGAAGRNSTSSPSRCAVSSRRA